MSTSEVITKTDLKNILEEILPSYAKSVEDWTPSITRTTGGTLSAINGKKFGKLCCLQFVASYSTSVAAGGNIYTGTLSNNKPILSSFGAGYFGAHSIVTQVDSDGNITVRNASSTAVTVSSGVTCTIYYLTA